MINITYTKDNTHIENSYQVTNRRTIENYVDWIVESRKARKYPVTRTQESYIREWIGHNRLYNWNIARKHTSSVDLDENMSMFWEIVWLIIGR